MHSETWMEPKPVRNVPERHAEHVFELLLPFAVEYVPGEHNVQFFRFIPPVFVKNVPFGHKMHVVTPLLEFE